jgi:spore germination protein KC
VSLLEVKDGTSNQLIKKELETLLTERFTYFFTKIQAKEADILGLGQYYRNQIPREDLEHWRSAYYPHLQMDIHFHTVIQNEGNLKSLSEIKGQIDGAVQNNTGQRYSFLIG